MLTLILSQSFLLEICNALAEDWMSRDDLLKIFNQPLVDAFLSDFNDYLSEGENEEGERMYTLGLEEGEAELFTAEILASNQKG